MKSEVYIHHHLGVGDHVCLNGMVWHIIEEGNFDKGYVFCKNKYFSNLKHLYTNSKVELIPIDENKPEVQSVDEIVSRSIGENDKFVRVGFCPVLHEHCDVFFYNIMNIPYEKRFNNFRIERNEKEDLKLGIDYLWEFKEKLNKLHPQVTYTIEKLLQNNYR